MKYFILTLIFAARFFPGLSQEYPSPEFSKEVYYLKKDNPATVTRLEKSYSKMETKTKMGGFGGAETAYLMEGEKSPVRLGRGSSLSFVFTAESASNSTSSDLQDSLFKANGMDPELLKKFNSSDPSNILTLYKADPGKGKRKILVQKSPGMVGGKKMKSGDKYTFSVKNVKPGYWELIIDKELPRGEYVFGMRNMSMTSMDNDMAMFGFGIE